MWNFARQTSPTFQGWGKDITPIGEVAGEVDWRSGGYPRLDRKFDLFVLFSEEVWTLDEIDLDPGYFGALRGASWWWWTRRRESRA